MDPLVAIALKVFDVALILFGFGAVIFLHELGHFVAAKWAGIRVLAFAIGFGPAFVTFRKGLGWRRGSSEHEYRERVVRAADQGSTSTISPTEYRINMLPLGGYVKMLGQDDAHPEYRSDEPDSFNRCPIWKRMVIISAGVVMNLLTAAALYVIVFTVGLRTEPAVVGYVMDASPAAEAVAVNADELGISETGLKPGDRVLEIGGRTPASFNDLILATAMAKEHDALKILVERPGVDAPVQFSITPRTGVQGLLELGITPAVTTTIRDPKSESIRSELQSVLETVGLGEVKPGMRLVSVDGEPVSQAAEIGEIVTRGRGAPVHLVFESDTGHVEADLDPEPELDTVNIGSEREPVLMKHIVGLTPVMTVGPLDPSARGYTQGLRTGDVFVRLGSTPYPNVAQGTAEIKARAGSTIEADVLRSEEGRPPEIVHLVMEVLGTGRIGFVIGSGFDDVLLALPPPADDPYPASAVVTRPGSRLLTLGGEPVDDFADIQRVLQRASDSAEVSDAGLEVPLRLRLPLNPSSDKPIERDSVLVLGPDDVSRIASLRWGLPIGPGVFEQEWTVLKASGPLDAIALGLRETRRVMRITYMTFLRLFEGSISPTNLNGPIGIVHSGTIVAERGVVWLLFFFALVSVNLAVINFLPIPITDGGHMLFLIWEQVTGKPVSIAVQNAATLAGLILIVSVFLFVTYNDILRLFGS
ncbi:MAG TPA: hypothetical protein ENJ00_07260 [Phycisphaerales bacterium]|nr:hypothetical protein [Phycisphaerales bacterium]